MRNSSAGKVETAFKSKSDTIDDSYRSNVCSLFLFITFVNYILLLYVHCVQDITYNLILALSFRNIFFMKSEILLS